MNKKKKLKTAILVAIILFILHGIEEYLTGLEHELKEEVTNKGYFPTTAIRITQEYRDMFYYSSLPSLMEASC